MHPQSQYLTQTHDATHCRNSEGSSKQLNMGNSSTGMYSILIYSDRYSQRTVLANLINFAHIDLNLITY